MDFELDFRVRISSWIFELGFRVGFSSWIFELGFFGGIFLAVFFLVGFPINFQWFYQRTLSVVLHIVSRSFQDGGERGLQIVKGNLV